jgi:hypothetical protein
MSFSVEAFCGRDETAVLELEEVEVLRERIGVEVDDKVDSMDLVERLDKPEFKLAEGRFSGPRWSTSHLHLYLSRI